MATANVLNEFSLNANVLLSVYKWVIWWFGRSYVHVAKSLLTTVSLERRPKCIEMCTLHTLLNMWFCCCYMYSDCGRCCHRGWSCGHCRHSRYYHLSHVQATYQVNTNSCCYELFTLLWNPLCSALRSSVCSQCLPLAWY